MNHTQALTGRDILVEVAQRRRLEQYASFKSNAYTRMAEQVARDRANVFSPADGSSVEVSVTGARFALKRMIPRTEGMKPTTGADLIAAILPVGGSYQPAHASKAQNIYRDVLTRTVSACKEAGLDLPMDSQVVHDALRVAELAPDDLDLPPLEEVRQPGAEARMAEPFRESHYGYGGAPVRRREDLRMERGSVEMRHRDMLGEGEPLATLVPGPALVVPEQELER